MRNNILVIGFLIGLIGSASGFSPKEEGFLDINGTKLYFLKVGQGEPLLILHGGPGLDHSYFLPQLSNLADKFQLIFFDQRGCGRSAVDVDSNTMTMKQYVEDVEAVRTALKLDKLNLFGHSFGGLIAMNYALKYPQHLKRLILANTTPATSRWRDSTFTLMKLRSNKADEEAIEKLTATDDFKKRKPATMNQFFRLLFRSSFYNQNFADSLTLNLQDTYPLTSKLMDRFYKDLSLKNYNLNAGLDTLKCRTLIIASEADIAPPSAAEDLHRHLKNSSYFMIEGAGHFPFIEQPRQFREVIDRFMKGN